MEYPRFVKMSDGVEWALHCATLLAVIPPGTTLTGAALAEFHGISESYLLKHLKALAAAGILESVPGPRGGYRLARPAASITLLEIVEAVDGPEPAFRCTEIRQRGPACLEPAAYPRPCAINAAMLRAESAWRAALKTQTIADITGALAQTIDPRAVEKGTAWLEEKLKLRPAAASQPDDPA